MPLLLNGGVAEWLGSGLQNRARQFDSARRLFLSLGCSGFWAYSVHETPPGWPPSRSNTCLFPPALGSGCRLPVPANLAGKGSGLVLTLLRLGVLSASGLETVPTLRSPH